jgi:uncharacterized protein (TIGR03382 family)
VSFAPATTTAYLLEAHGNVFTGYGQVISTQAGVTLTSSGEANWTDVGTDSTGLGATTTGADPGFENAALLDLRPRVDSPLKGQAVAAAATVAALGAPTHEYFRDETELARARIRSSFEDLGAFEYGTSGPVIQAGNPVMPDAGAVLDGGILPDAREPPSLLPVRVGCESVGAGGWLAALLAIVAVGLRRRKSAPRDMGACLSPNRDRGDLSL